MKQKHFVLFLLLFLISGAAGLVYEIVWERLLELYFGVTMTAITLIVAAYMGGLGLGSLFGGRLARRLKSVLLAYGLVELGVGLFGLFSPALIGWLGRMTAGSPYGLVFIMSFALLLIPTFLMGMTLPLLAQAFIDRVETSGEVVGRLYGINTLGAACGALLAGYILIGWLGFDGATTAAVFLNLIAGIGAISLIKWQFKARTVDNARQRPSPPARMQWGYRTILFASFLVGFIGLGFEMLWIRILNIVNKNTAYGFPTILFVFLIGLAVGGYFWGRKADRTPDPAELFWKIELGVGILASLCFLLFWATLNMSTTTVPWLREFWHFQRPVSPVVAMAGQYVFSKRVLLLGIFEYLLPIGLLALPASLVMGGGLPILDRIAINSPEVAGRRVGDIHLANILGAVFGTLTISFVLLPTIGSELTLKALVLLSLTFPALYLQAQRKSQKAIRPSPSLAIFSATALFMIVILPWKGQFYTRLFEVGAGARALTLESADSVLALTTSEGAQHPDWLWISGETNSFFPADGTYEGRALACAGASQPKRVLIIGMGGGNTAYFFVSLPNVEEIVIVELMEDLGSFLKENLPTARTVLTDPRVRYIVDDGRRYLYAHPNEKFDLISIDPLRRYTVGHNNLYSVEAMNLYRSHLSKGSVLCGYVDQQHILPLTIAAAFPEVDHFRNRVAIASNAPMRYDLAYMQDAAEIYLNFAKDSIKPAAAEALAPKTVLSNFIRDRAQIIADEPGMPVLTDLKPWLEYYFFSPPPPKQSRVQEATLQAFLQRINGCDADCREEIQTLRKKPLP